MNNDMIPVGTTVHINPEDIKWNNERPIVFTISYNRSTKSYTIATTDERVVCIDKVTDNLLSAEIMEAMCNITGLLNNKGCAILFEVVRRMR